MVASSSDQADVLSADDVWRVRISEARRRLEQGDAASAASLLMASSAGPSDGAPLEAQSLLATALRRLGRTDEALPILERLAALRPLSAVAQHNLAAALGDLGQMQASAAAARRSIAKGGGAPETWLVLGRALTGLGQLDEAEAAYRHALQLRPDHLDACRELAQLEWMRTGCRDRLEETLHPLRRAARSNPSAAVTLCAILRATLGDAAALEALGPWLGQPQLNLDVALAGTAAAVEPDPALALELAEIALAQSGGRGEAKVAYSCALMACDQPQPARELLSAHLERHPTDRAAQGLLEAARRMLKDPQALGPADYRRLVQAYPLFPDLDEAALLARMDQLAVSLRALHPFTAPPFAQSIRGGVQSRLDPRTAGDPLIEALFDRLADPISAYIAAQGSALGTGPEAAAWRLTGAWSVRLRAGDRHVDHIHPGSWISSALYVDLPPGREARGKEGWLRFGAAPIGAGRTLPAQHWVQPRRGWLVLFPSWLWHGTEPFSGGGDRLTVAFNVDLRERA